MSDRSIVLPSDTDIAPLFFKIRSCSISEKPPSGPIRTDHFSVVFFIGMIASIIDLLSVFDSSQKINFLSLGQVSSKDLRSTSFSIFGISNL